MRPPGAATAGADRPAAAAVPPLPPTTPSATPAALAGGPLDPTRPELRIGSDPAAGTGGPTWQGAGRGTAGVALQAPQPITGGAVALEPKPATGLQLTGNTSAPTYEQLKAQLLARGVSWIRVEADAQTGETTLICHVPKNGSPNVHQTYQTKARDEVSAMRAVLDRIDKGQ